MESKRLRSVTSQSTLLHHVLPCWRWPTLVLFLVAAAAGADQCSRLGPCRWRCDTPQGTGVVDLTSVGNEGGIAFQDVSAPDKYKYSYNPCFPFDEPGSPDTAECTAQDGVVVCQISTDASQSQWNAGTEASEKFEVRGDDVIVKYTGSQYNFSPPQFRRSEVTLKCGSANTISASGDADNSGLYKFTLTTPEACNFTPDHNEPSGGFSIGSTICVIVLPLIFVYFVGGIVFNTFYRKRSGREAVPQADFWAAVPSYIKAGFLFTGSKLRLPGCRDALYLPV